MQKAKNMEESETRDFDKHNMPIYPVKKKYHYIMIIYVWKYPKTNQIGL